MQVDKCRVWPHQLFDLGCVISLLYLGGPLCLSTGWLLCLSQLIYIEHIYGELSQSDLEARLNVVTINLHCYLEHQLLGSRLVGWDSKVNRGKALLPLSIENKCIHSGMGVGVTDWAQWQSTDLESVRLSSVLRDRKRRKKIPPKKVKTQVHYISVFQGEVICII